MTRKIAAFVLFVCSGFVATRSFAQQFQVATGTPPFSSTASSPDVTNLGNLNVHFAVPVFSKPGRGMAFTYVLSFDSSIWYPTNVNGQLQWQYVSNFGWRGQTEVATGYISRDVIDSQDCWVSVPPNDIQLLKGTTTTYGDWEYHDAFGQVHPFAGQTVVQTSSDTTHCGTAYTTSMSATASDGSGYTISATGGKANNVNSTAGKIVNAPTSSTTGSGQATDSNGNQITVDNSGNFFDTLSSTSRALSVSGGAPNPLVFTYTDSNNTNQTVTVNYKQYTVQTYFGCSGISEFPPTTEYLVDTIVFPDASYYQFWYETSALGGNTTGRIQKIQLRTGGPLSYTYTTGALNPPAVGTGIPAPNPIVCSDGSTAGMWRRSDDGYTKYERDGSGTSWTTKVTDATNNDTKVWFQTGGGAPTNFYETKRQAFAGSVGGTVMRTVDTCYNGTTPDCTGTGITLPITKQDVYTTLDDNQKARVLTTFDAIYGRPVETDEYDFGATSPMRKTVTQYAANQAPDRVSSVIIQDGSSTTKAQTNYTYDGGTVTGTSGIPQHIAPVGPRGNLTQISQWLNTNNTWLNTTLAYDDTGMVSSATDPKANATSFAYSNSNAYVSTVTMPQTGSVAHVTHASYDSNTGLVTSSTDQNGNVTYIGYDGMLRPLSITYPDGGNTQFTYTATSTETKQKIDASGNVIDQVTYLDGLGRPVQSVLTDPEGNDSSDTTYDADGRVHSVTNPHRSTASGTDGTTSYTYDALNRVVTITQPDAALVQTAYSGATVTVTDEANNPRETISDGLGRLVQVIEPNPATKSLTAGQFTTNYTYDVLGNVLSVNQAGNSNPSARNRNFSYDSLSRLISGTVPESGQTQYGYDSNGNVTSVTDARSLTTTIGYDALNRPTIKTYSDGSSAREFLYDQASHGSGVGRLTHASNDVNAAYDPTYDVMGRIISQTYCIPSDCSYNTKVSASYDLAGELTSLTYPSGRKIVNSYSTAGRLTKVNYDSFNGTTVNYPYYTVPQGTSSTTWGYFPTAAPARFSFGQGVSETLGANNRLMLSQITASIPAQTLLSKTYSFSSPNNGNIAQITDGLNNNRTQQFSYDYLNRLTGAHTVATSGSDAWSESYTTDPWGNMNQSGTSSFAPGFDANNRISATGYSYDLAGNLLTDGFHTYTYDTESRMKTVDSTAASYTYGPDGERTRKDVSGSWTEYVFFGGQVVAEKSSTGDWTDYIFAGQRIAKAEGLNRDLHIYGTTAGTSQYSLFYFPSAAGLSGRVIQSGDKMYFTQYQETGSKGGLILIFSDGSSSGWNVKDQDGYWLNDDQKQNTTHVRIADLSGLAGKTISQVVLNNESDTTPGSWNIYYDNISFVGVDGSVKPVYTGQTSSPISSISGTSGETGLGSTIDTNTGKATHPSDTTTYYTADHLGSSRLLTSGTGYPIWSGVFLPYGQEFSPQITMNNYKFTGDEHDSESNLDHTMYRQLSSAQGRWLSPDPYLGSMDLTNPQSMNRYAYVMNNPVNAFDPLGLKCVTLDNGVVGDDGTEPPCGDDMTSGNGQPDATVDGGGASGYATGIGFDPGSYCIIYGCGGYSKNGGVTNFPMTGPAPPPPAPAANTGQKQTFSQCMATNASTFSLAGAAQGALNGVLSQFGTSVDFKDTFVAQFFGGNTFSLLYGSTGDAASVAATNTPNLLRTAMGTVTTYGRNTSTITSLNIARSGGLPQALSSSSSGVRGLLGAADKILGLGMSFTTRLEIDATLAAAEAAYCAYTTR